MEEKKKKRYKIPWILLLVDLDLVGLLVGILYFADREGLAAFLRVRRNLVPLNPESIENPKEEMVRIARRSRSRRIVQGMVPAEGLSSKIGPNYTAYLSEFAMNK